MDGAPARRLGPVSYRNSGNSGGGGGGREGADAATAEIGRVRAVAALADEALAVGVEGGDPLLHLLLRGGDEGVHALRCDDLKFAISGTLK
jgi:hypothetical protein